jgi:hypothetical protein
MPLPSSQRNRSCSPGSGCAGPRAGAERAVAAHHDPLHPRRQGGQRRLDQPPVAGPRRHVAVAELVGQHHVLLGPERDHRLVAAAPVIGRPRAPLLAGEDGGVNVDGRHRLRPVLLQPGDQPAVDRAQPLQALAFARHLAARALPQRRRRLVEPLEEVARGLGRREAVAEEQGQRRILAQLHQILAALAARGPEREQPLDQLRRRQAALAALDHHPPVEHRRGAARPERLDHQRHPAMSGDEPRLRPLIQLERKPRLHRHLVPRCAPGG